MSSVIENSKSVVTNGFPSDHSDADLSDIDREEKQRLIKQVLELQHTLVDLSKRVDTVREENANLRTANQILGQYIEKLMATSSIFQSSSPPPVSHQSHVSMSSSTHMDGSDSAIGGFQYEESSELASEDDIA